MNTNLTNLILSILNPNGRFRTLKGIYAVCDDEGEPRMTVGNHTADFEVMHDEKPHTLKFLLHHDNDHAVRLREIATYTSRIDSPHIVPYRYLDGEMVVFNHRGEPEWRDAIIQQQPDGMRLDEHLAALAERGDRMAIAATVGALAELAEWVAASGFAHGELSARNIWITPEGVAVAANYEKSERGRAHGDLVALGCLAAAVHATACCPEIYADTVHEKIQKLPGLRKLMSTLVDDILGGEDARELREIYAIVSPSDEASDRAICEAIRRFSLVPPRSYPALEKFARGNWAKNGGSERDNNAESAGKKGVASDVKAKYTVIGEMSDMLMVAIDAERRWCYINRNGAVVIPGPFKTAWSFSEGRAVVETDEGYGLIDREGRFVIPAGCCDLAWDSLDNIAIVTIDGKSGIFSREGERLTELKYDQILECSEGMIPVRLGGKYGYLRRDGSEAIAPIYDDAFGFRDGRARVRSGRREMLIDTEGNRVAEIKTRHSSVHTAAKKPPKRRMRKG